METREVLDEAAAARRARFGTLPARTAFADMVVEKPVSSPTRPGDTDDPESRWTAFNCLAVDLGL